jgi:probable lipoprotein NlpC
VLLRQQDFRGYFKVWANKYIGIPFKPNGRDRNGLDCWGLVCLVHKEELGLELFPYNDIFLTNSHENLKHVAKVIQEGKEKLKEIKKPEPFDIIVLRAGTYIWHVGIVIDKKRMLHVMDGIESVVEEYTGLFWRDRIDGFRRHIDR